jgi:hypothetical protein
LFLNNLQREESGDNSCDSNKAQGRIRERFQRL